MAFITPELFTITLQNATILLESLVFFKQIQKLEKSNFNYLLLRTTTCFMRSDEPTRTC